MSTITRQFYCNFGWGEENRSFNRGLRYVEVRQIEVPLYQESKPGNEKPKSKVRSSYVTVSQKEERKGLHLTNLF